VGRALHTAPMAHGLRQRTPYASSVSEAWAVPYDEETKRDAAPSLLVRYKWWLPGVACAALACALLLWLARICVFDATEWEGDVETLRVVEHKLLVRMASTGVSCLSTAEVASPMAGLVINGSSQIMWKPQLRYADPHQLKLLRWKNSPLCDGSAAIKASDGSAAIKASDGSAAIKASDGSAAIKASAAIELGYHDGANSPKTHTITHAPTAYCVQHALLVLSGDQADVRC
jgi:hypothetical protein